MSEKVTVKMALAENVWGLLNAQVTRERYASAVYSALATWADGQGFEGLRAWADRASAEEATHAQRFIDYLRDRGAVRLEAVAAPPAEFGGYVEGLWAALALERGVSAALTEIYTATQELGDGATAALLAEFLKEQVQAEKELTTYIQRVQRGDPLDLLDIELREHADE